MSPDELLQRLEVGLRHPQASGFEVLELLDARSALAQIESDLSGPERRRIEQADRVFLAQARELFEGVREVADLSEQRERAGIPPSHWWWYLDELVHVGDSDPTVEGRVR